MAKRRPRAVVISDSNALRMLIAATLGDSGFDVAAAADGASGLALLDRAPADIAVLTARLPGHLDGPETIRLARRRSPLLKALFITESHAEASAIDDDRDEAIPRPFDERRLLGCVYELLLRDSDYQTATRQRYAAEFGIEAARRVCLRNQAVAA